MISITARISLRIHSQIITGLSTLDLDTFGLGTSTLVELPTILSFPSRQLP